MAIEVEDNQGVWSLRNQGKKVFQGEKNNLYLSGCCCWVLGGYYSYLFFFFFFASARE